MNAYIQSEQSEKSVAVGFSFYFIGLALIGTAIYQWSKPKAVAAIVDGVKHALHAPRSEGGAKSVLVEYGVEATAPGAPAAR